MVLFNNKSCYIYIIIFFLFRFSNKKAQRFKAKTLSKIFKIDQPVKTNKSSSPDIDLIKRLKEKIIIDNPLLRLSIENYTQMCKNKMLFNMMVKVLETNKKGANKDM